MRSLSVCGISPLFKGLSHSEGQVAYALLGRPPLRNPPGNPEGPSLDLHGSGAPPTFVLSQDQTLHWLNIFLFRNSWTSGGKHAIQFSRSNSFSNISIAYIKNPVNTSSLFIIANFSSMSNSEYPLLPNYTIIRSKNFGKCLL